MAERSYRTWRERARVVIAEVLKETEGQSESEIRRALREAFPFGPRDYYPYKVWLDEIKVQRGLKKPKRPPRVPPPDPNQRGLFEGEDEDAD